MKGHKHTQKSKNKIRLARLGKKRAPFSDEWKKNMSLCKKGIDPVNRISLYTPELNKKRSEKMKGRPRTWETPLTEEGRKKIIELRKGSIKKFWGDNIKGYKTIHVWVNRKLGKPCMCENCKNSFTKPRQLHWANKSGEYKRDLTDWLRLCAKCHFKHDRR